jgi:hypothetical protein
VRTCDNVRQVDRIVRYEMERLLVDIGNLRLFQRLTEQVCCERCACVAPAMHTFTRSAQEASINALRREVTGGRQRHMGELSALADLVRTRCHCAARVCVTVCVRVGGQ